MNDDRLDVLRHWIDEGRVLCACGRWATGTTPGGIPECDNPGCHAAVEFERAHPATTRGAVARADAAEGELRQFQAGLTDALRAHNVPAMPRWADAIHWLARHGGRSS